MTLDYKSELKQVARAFDKLEKEHKVLHFGVSIFNASQIEYLQKYCHQKIEINQLQLSLVYNHMIHVGEFVNTESNHALDRDGHILDYCKLHDITIQCWSPIQWGFFTGTFLNNPDYEDLNQVLQNIADKYHVSKSAVAIAYLLKLPLSIQAVIGTTKMEYLKEYLQVKNFSLTREEWYLLTKMTKIYLP